MAGAGAARPGSAAVAGVHTRRRRFSDPPTSDVARQRPHAATITKGPDLIEERLCDVLALPPAGRQENLMHVNCASARTVAYEQIGGRIGVAEASHGLAIELELPRDGA